MFIFINAWLLIFRRHHLLEYILAYDDLNWLKWFIRLGLVVVIFWAFAVGIKTITENEDAYILLRLSSSILLYWIGYQGLKEEYLAYYLKTKGLDYYFTAKDAGALKQIINKIQHLNFL